MALPSGSTATQGGLVCTGLKDEEPKKVAPAPAEKAPKKEKGEGKKEKGEGKPDGKKEKGEAPAAAVPDDVELQRDVVYGKGGEVSLKMDIYRPKTLPREPLPVVVYVHGGGWSKGSKEMSADKLVPLVQRGYCGVSINYRLTPSGVQFPEPLYDCKCAIRFLRALLTSITCSTIVCGASASRAV
jgi:acetyl esterase/lipase